MKILIIGGGGREHAVAKALIKNVAVERSGSHPATAAQLPSAKT